MAAVEGTVQYPAVLTDVLAQNELPTVLPNPDAVFLHRFTLKFFTYNKTSVSALETAFYRRNARRFLVALRVTTIIFCLANVMLIGYDNSRFENLGSSRFTAALIIRLAVMLPLCLITYLYTYTRWYFSHTNLLTIPFFLLGGSLIAYSISGKNPGYGTLALFIVYMLSFSPLSVWPSAVVTTSLVVAFGISLALTKDEWLTVGNKGLDSNGAGTGSAIVDYGTQMTNIMGVLSVFLIIVGFISHTVELSLKRAFLDEFRLQSEMIKLQEEKMVSASLLNSMLPHQIVTMLKNGRLLIAESVNEVTVLFCELDVDTSKYPAEKVVAILNIIFSAFDALVDERFVRKIETVACVWLGVSSPFMQSESPNEATRHAIYVAELALGMVGAMPGARERIRQEVGVNPDEIGMRVGLNSGPVAAGIVGIKNPRYKLIGDTVNTASRMESTCIGGRIQISNTTYRSLISIAKNRYTVKPRGNIPVKGKGQMYTYWLEGRHGEPKLAPVPDDEFVPSEADALELDAVVPPPIDVNVQAAVGLSLEVALPSPSRSAELTRQLSTTCGNAATSPTSPLWSSGGKDIRHLRQQSTGAVSQKFTAAALAANAATAEASLEAAFDLMAAKSSRSLARKRDDTEADGSRLHMDPRNQAGTEVDARPASLEPTADSQPALSRTRSTGRLRSSKSERIVPKDQKSRTATGANVATTANVDTTVTNEPQKKTKSSLRRATTRKLSGVAIDVNSGRAKSTANQDPIGVQDSEAREQALVAYFDSVNVERSAFHSNGGGLDPDEEYEELSYASRIANDPLSRSITTFVDIDLARFNGAPVVKTSVSRQEPQTKTLDGHATLVMNGEVLRRRPEQPLGRNNSFTQQACTVVEQTGRDAALPWSFPVPEATRTSTHAIAASRRASMAPKPALPWWKTMSFGDRHWQDRATLCLNKPMMKGDAALWERDFQHDMQGRWRNFVRLSVVILIVVLALFTLQDWYKYGGITPSSIDNPAKVWRDVAIIRYAVLVPILLVFLGCTYMPWFSTRWWFTQVTTGIAMVAIGTDLIALSVVGNEPGYGVLALYLVYCVNVSLLALLFRFAILLILIAAYIGAVLGFYKSSEFRNDAAFGVVYLAIFFFGEMCPVLLREHSVRQNYFRKHRIEVERRKLAEEQLKSTKLLENLLPPVIVKKLRSSKRTLIADTFKEVTILWTDMKGFTNFSAHRPPLEVVSFLNAMFSTFDRILDKYGVRKIEVLGDAFFCCAGVPVFTPDHAERCANAALEMQMHMPTLRSFAGADISMRIGVHTGPVIAGVVGLKDPRYHLFGDSVPYANAMESNGEPGMVHISKPTYDLLKSRQEIRARDFVQFVQCQHSQGRKPPQLSDAIRHVATHGSSSLGRYPAVHMSLLDEYLHQSLGAVEADDHEIIDDATAFIAGVADEPQAGRGSGILGAPSTEITCVPEACDDAVRGQLQLWKNATFLGWDIEVNTVQGALLYTDVPTTQEAVQLPTPTVDNAASSLSGSVTARAALNIPAFFTKRLPTNASQATEAAAGDEFGPDISRTANGCYWPADSGDFFGPGGGFFAFEERAIDIKGRGPQTTYFLTRADPPFMPVVALELTKLQGELETWAAAQAPATTPTEPEQPAPPRPAGMFPAIGSASEYRMVAGRPSSARPMSGRPTSISVRLTPDASPRLYPANAPSERPHTPKVRSPIAAAKTALASDVVAMQRKKTAAGAIPVAPTQFIAEVDA